MQNYRFLTSHLAVLMILAFLNACDSEPNLQPIFRVDWSIKSFEEDPSLQRFQDPKTDFYGYKDQNNQVVIPAQYPMGLPFNMHGWADVYEPTPTNPTRWIKINPQAQTLVESYFFDNGPDYYVGGLARYVANGKIGFVDEQAKIVIPAQYDFAREFGLSAPITIVCQGCISVPACPSGSACEHRTIEGGTWGVIDARGKVIVPLDYDAAEGSFEHTLVLRKGEKRYELFWDGQDDYVLKEQNGSN